MLQVCRLHGGATQLEIRTMRPPIFAEAAGNGKGGSFSGSCGRMKTASTRDCHPELCWHRSGDPAGGEGAR
jgi:hypothetical protein